MSILQFTSLGIIREEDGWKLLEEKSINDRTILVWYNPDTKVISLMLFHVSDQPNELSKRSPDTTWGFVTFYATEMKTPKEAAEVVSLYLQDMEKSNFWLEEIN